MTGINSINFFSPPAVKTDSIFTSNNAVPSLFTNGMNFNMPMPSASSLPPNFGLMMDSFCKSQEQMQAILLAILTRMAQDVKHIPETKNVRPYDYTKYDNAVSKTNSQKIAELTPEMQEKTMQLLDFAKNKLGRDININSGYRTQEEQAYLRQKTPHLAAKKSAHCEGLAVDISLTGKPDDKGKSLDDDYKALGDYAKSIGMRWGGDFKSQKERWHFDYNWG